MTWGHSVRGLERSICMVALFCWGGLAIWGASPMESASPGRLVGEVNAHRQALASLLAALPEDARTRKREVVMTFDGEGTSTIVHRFCRAVDVEPRFQMLLPETDTRYRLDGEFTPLELWDRLGELLWRDGYRARLRDGRLEIGGRDPKWRLRDALGYGLCVGAPVSWPEEELVLVEQAAAREKLAYSSLRRDSSGGAASEYDVSNRYMLAGTVEMSSLTRFLRRLGEAPGGPFLITDLVLALRAQRGQNDVFCSMKLGRCYLTDAGWELAGKLSSQTVFSAEEEARFARLAEGVERGGVRVGPGPEHVLLAISRHMTTGSRLVRFQYRAGERVRIEVQSRGEEWRPDGLAHVPAVRDSLKVSKSIQRDGTIVLTCEMALASDGLPALSDSDWQELAAASLVSMEDPSTSKEDVSNEPQEDSPPGNVLPRPPPPPPPLPGPVPREVQP